jgi:hypothetical protein
MDSASVKDVATEAGHNRFVQRGARLGYAVNGILHLLIAWLALQVAWSASGKNADQSGALQTLSENTFGRILLWVSVVGFAFLALWQVAQAVSGRGMPGEEWKDRLKAISKAVVYVALGYSAFTFARGQGKSSKKQTVDLTAGLMGATGGRLLVALVGLVIVGVGAYHVIKGYKRKFLADLVGHPGQWATRAGRFGYIAKGIALGVVGVLFVVAGLKEQPAKATGLDGALRTLKDQPFGPVLLTLIALGIAAYGIYSFARARYARV